MRPPVARGPKEASRLARPCSPSMTVVRPSVASSCSATQRIRPMLGVRLSVGKATSSPSRSVSCRPASSMSAAAGTASPYSVLEIALEPEPTIVCVDCGGRCHLLTHPPEDGLWEPGDIVAYRCEDCLDRWDLVLPDDVEDTYD